MVRPSTRGDARRRRRNAMTKAELLDVIAKANSEMTKKQVGEVVDAVFNTVAKAIKKDGEFSYPGFGSFKVRQRKARTGRNPQTGEQIKIKASKSVGFKAAKAFKDKL
jgi:DNA-binding protein HU-beta